MDRRGWQATVHQVAKESHTTEQLTLIFVLKIVLTFMNKTNNK